MSNTPAQLAEALRLQAAGGPSAAERLLPLVYDRLRALAGRYLRGERPDHTLQPTALVHEAYVRMIDVKRIDWAGKTHFFAMAARQMRRILVEHARAVGAQRRGAGRRRVEMEDHLAVTAERSLEVLMLEEALSQLAARHERQAHVAELRLFGGMSVDETAQALGVSQRTVKRDWRVARAWLARAMSGEEGGA